MPRTLTEQEREEFDDILIEMEFLISDLIDLFSRIENDRDQRLDFSPTSLDFVEDFLLKIVDERVTLDRSREAIVVRVAYYYGEVVIRNIGGRWVQSEYDDDSFASPIVESYSKTPNVFQDPLMLCWTLCERKQRGTLTRAFQSALRWGSK
jgi:hypothetical protein